MINLERTNNELRRDNINLKHELEESKKWASTFGYMAYIFFIIIMLVM